jgi:hypothetical protein
MIAADDGLGGDCNAKAKVNAKAKAKAKNFIIIEFS